MDESFRLPGRAAELNWKLLFIPPVSRRRIRFVCNWFKPGGSFCGGKAKVFLLMEKMIEFVLSRVPLRLLSFYPLPVSVNQIISLPCQHTLLVEQSELICRRALPHFLPLPLPFIFLFCLFFFCPLPFFLEILIDSLTPLLRVLLSHSRKKGLSYTCTFFNWQSQRFTCCASFDEMMNPVSRKWCFALSQSNPPSYTYPWYGSVPG